MTISDSEPMTGNGSAFRRLWPVVLLIAAVGALFVFGPDNGTMFRWLSEYRGTLLAFVDDNAVAAVLVFFAAYVLVVALSLPGGAMMTLAGAFFFGALNTAVYVVFAATIGATLLFLIARTAVGNRLRARAGPWMKKMEAGFRENALSYLLVLRLIPLFPFFIVNLVPAFLGVSLRTYVVATFFGIIPGTVVYSLAGGGLGSVLDAGEEFSAASVLTPEIIAALVGLGALAALPVVYKKFRSRQR